MPDVVAIVSKAVFEKDARGLSPGDCWPTDAYVSQNKGLAPLAQGGRLFLVTVRPPAEALWLVAVLEAPTFDGTRWSAQPNVVPIRDITEQKAALRFANGAGLPSKPGVLGMSLQTPRVLAETDPAVLLGARAKTEAKSNTSTAAPAPRAVKQAPDRTSKAPAAAAPAKQSTRAANGADWVELGQSGQWPQLLDQLLVRWRSGANQRLADVIAKVGARIAPKPDVVAKTWEASAQALDPTVVDALLAATLAKGSKVGKARVEAIEAWPLDPRIDRWVAEHYATPPLTSTGARPYWVRLQPLLKRIRDAAAVARIATARAAFGDDAHSEFMAGHVDKVLPALKALVEAPLSDAETQSLTALSPLLGATPPDEQQTEARVEQVLLQPMATDEHLLSVLADALSERGDPRGELIALQLDPQPDAKKIARIKVILKTARAELLGSLDGAVKSDAEFRRGFVSRVAIKQGNAASIATAIKKSVGDELWATVEHLEGPGDAEVSKHPVMRSLRSLVNSDLSVEELAALHLESYDGSLDEDEVKTLVEPARFKSLMHLRLKCHLGAGGALLTPSPLVSRLASLTLRLQVRRSNGPFQVQAADGRTINEHTQAVTLFKRAHRLQRRQLRLEFLRDYDTEWSTAFDFERSESNETTIGVSVASSMSYEGDARLEALQNDLIEAIATLATLTPTRLELRSNFSQPSAAMAVQQAALRASAVIL